MRYLCTSVGLMLLLLSGTASGGDGQSGAADQDAVANRYPVRIEGTWGNRDGSKMSWRANLAMDGESLSGFAAIPSLPALGILSVRGTIGHDSMELEVTSGSSRVLEVRASLDGKSVVAEVSGEEKKHSGSVSWKYRPPGDELLVPASAP